MIRRIRPRRRIGIASGNVFLGNIGTYHKMDFSAIGPPVNLASRITALAKPGSVLVDLATKEAAGEGFRYSFAGERRLKGFDSRFRLYRARRPGDDT